MNFLLKRMRKEMHLSQTELANSVGVSLSTVGSWERGESYPNSEQLWNCAVALGCTPNDLLGWEVKEAEPLTPEESQLLDRYRECTAARRESVMQSAADAVTLSKGERAAPPAIAVRYSRREVSRHEVELG